MRALIRNDEEKKFAKKSKSDPTLNEEVLEKPHICTFWTEEDEKFEL